MFWCGNIVHTILVTNLLHIFAVGATLWARCDAWMMMQQWLQHYRALNLVTKGTGVQFDISSVIEPTASSDLRFVDQEEIIQNVLFCHSSWLCRDQVLCSAVVGLTKVVQPLPFESKSAMGHVFTCFYFTKAKGTTVCGKWRWRHHCEANTYSNDVGTRSAVIRWSKFN